MLIRNFLKKHSEGKSESYLFKIQSISLSLIFGFVTGSYTIIRVNKDSIIFNLSPKGAAFCKFWLVIPMTLIIIKVFWVITEKKKLISTVKFFVGFFFVIHAVYTFLAISNLLSSGFELDLRDHIYKFGAAGLWLIKFSSFQNFLINIKIFLEFPFVCIYYTIVETWCAVVLNYGFWIVVTESYDKEQIKSLFPSIIRISGLFTLSSGVAAIMNVYMSEGARGAKVSGAWDVIRFTFIKNCFWCLVIFAALWFLFDVVKVFCYDNREKEIEEIKKARSLTKVDADENVSYFNGVKFIFKTPLLLGLFVITIFYGMSVNLIEISWKTSIQKLGGKAPIAYAAAFIAQGFLTLTITVKLKKLIQRLSVRTIGFLTPFFVALIAFSFVFLAKFIPSQIVFFGYPFFAILPWIGTGQNAIIKISKYCFFDALREITYSMLPLKSRITGKAIIDVIGGKISKQAGSALILILSIFWISPEQNLRHKGIEPYYGAFLLVFAIVFVLWILAIFMMFRNQADLKSMSTSKEDKS